MGGERIIGSIGGEARAFGLGREEPQPLKSVAVARSPSQTKDAETR